MFKSLVCAISEQCQEIKQAMTYFPYFDSWDADTIAECCRVSSTAEFSPDEIILGPGVGATHTVHFVLGGICRVVQHLQIETKVGARGEVKHKLVKSADTRKALADLEANNESFSSRLFSRKEKSLSSEGERTEQENEESERLSKEEKQEQKKKEKSEENQEQEKESSDQILSDSGREIVFEPDHHLKVLEECKKRREDAICGLKASSVPETSKNVKSLFVEVGALFAGASFGLGKLGKENFVMSYTAVKVLKIPLRFLLSHNPCNIWNRISLFHSLYLFPNEKVFEYYENEKKWNERKKSQTEEILPLKNIPNYTSICDVPYSIRLSTSR